jgi:hypothetical protein
MKRYINPNYIKASNFIMASAGLAIINYLLVGSFTLFFQLAIVALTITLLFVMALLIRKGYHWAKWVFVVLTLLGWVTLFDAVPAVFKANVIAGCISVLQNVFYVVAIVLLLIPSKQPLIDSTTESTVI